MTRISSYVGLRCRTKVESYVGQYYLNDYHLSTEPDWIYNHKVALIPMVNSHMLYDQILLKIFSKSSKILENFSANIPKMGSKFFRHFTKKFFQNLACFIPTSQFSFKLYFILTWGRIRSRGLKHSNFKTSTSWGNHLKTLSLKVPKPVSKPKFSSKLRSLLTFFLGFSKQFSKAPCLCEGQVSQTLKNRIKYWWLGSPRKNDVFVQSVQISLKNLLWNFPKLVSKFPVSQKFL